MWRGRSSRVYTVPATEVHWRGSRFRSQLEVRWAVFFELLGLRWFYEPAKFRVTYRIGYIPDFYLQGVEVGGMKGVWVEVKPGAFTSDEYYKAASVVVDERKPFLCLAGRPGNAVLTVLMPGELQSGETDYLVTMRKGTLESVFEGTGKDVADACARAERIGFTWTGQPESRIELD